MAAGESPCLVGDSLARINQSKTPPGAAEVLSPPPGSEVLVCLSVCPYLCLWETPYLSSLHDPKRTGKRLRAALL